MTEEVKQEWADENIVNVYVDDISEEAKVPPEAQEPPKPLPKPVDLITPNFALSEFTKSDTANRLGLKNIPNNQERANIKRVAEWLEKLRELLAEKHGRVIPIRITSGFRSAEVNKRVGGRPNSAHRYGLAADIQAVGLSIKQLTYDIYEFIEAGKLPRPDQLIREMPKGGGQWVHVGLSHGQPRGQYMVYEVIAATGRNGYKTVCAFKNPELA